MKDRNALKMLMIGLTACFFLSGIFGAYAMGNPAAGPDGAGNHGSAPKSAESGSSVEALLKAINQVRERYNLVHLTLDRRLSRAAEDHSRDMAEDGFFSHQSLDGTNPAERASRQGYDWMYVSENLSCGHKDVEAVVKSWMESPEHKKNMLNERAEHIGLGMARDPKGDCSPYWTAVFAAPK